ncbi:cardiolipin synthetase 2 [Sphingomonas laterariae]|uniref:Cardiolipin synthase n=1 Tax=Edaphosphingomonas laterariae TaxID=861865 RepID=A0A239CBZ1_9SPHN|nr:cardiolipin synthase [Sphingomonas laterariae]SNS17747.1 cardiolipin synthetase 2 [Sphingomonas laterariae]
MTLVTFPELGTAWYVFEWLIRLVMLVVVPRRRAPTAAASWLLLIFFLPVPGLLLFLAIGSPKFPQWRSDRFRRLAPRADALVARLAAAPATLDGRDKDIAALAQRLGRLPPVGGNAVALIDDYDGMIRQLIADIDGARRSVRLLVYIFADDATGRAVIAALARAVARGVACHVLVDPVGSHRWVRGTLQLLRAAGVDVRTTLPMRLLRGRTRRDMRNHRKLFLIDGAIGYAGSQNIVDKDFRPGVVNRELVVRAEGPIVAEMDGLFVADWFLETEAMLDAAPAIPPAAGPVTAQLLPSGADFQRRGFETLLVWQLHQARHRAVIVTPYLIPNEDLLAAMQTASLRGVEVHLVVSAVVDQALVNLAQSSYYDELLRHGVRIHRFRDYLLHAKSVSIDGRLAIVGSSNVDIRSFQLNEEVSLLLFGADAAAPLDAIQRGYIAGSDELTLDAWRRRPTPRKIGENLARLMSPLL